MVSSHVFVRASDSDKIAALQKLWPGITRQQYQEEQWTRFFQYMDLELDKLNEDHSLFSIVDHSEALQLIERLRRNGSQSKDMLLRTIVSGASPGQIEIQAVHRSLELAARLWLTINVDSFHLNSHLANMHSKSIVWRDGESLADAISAYVKPKSMPPQEGRIRPILTMAYLESRHGFQVRWTHNLAEHLIVDWKHRTVTVYEHLICLWSHLETAGGLQIIPRAMLEEVIDTLNLLFPSESKETQDYLRKHGRTFWKLGYCKGKRALEISRYVYWQDSVQQLMDIVEEPPTGFQQFRLDRERKNMLEFATFWTAAVVALLTTLSIVFGTVATVYTIKQYDIAAAAYNLQLAQICATQREFLPRYC
ncbi:hypothetical protein F4678DRAFT_412317 [Xylaria arbuscula]|nr:hypothetical protein F4678DRAFT_412317 [Xylaria arbuscula]